MQTSAIFSRRGSVIFAHRASRGCRVAALAGLIAIGCVVTTGRAQPSDSDAPGAQVLTRGPVHEAFAGMVTYNPEPGIVVTKAPPDPIEEVPPEERPEGDNVAWIPGYWAWDDERSDFLWISGTWRALPPGREWLAGYWGQTAQGYQWTSGYWADANATEETYLPAPPETVEAGPNIEAPSADYNWTPGCWLWHEGRYAWRPGYWTEGRADWEWIPANYMWTPRGYLFVEGYWDYPAERRGILFAPVYFERSEYSRRGRRYSPTIVIGLDVFSDHLFLRPSYRHYYFGDYYASSYDRGGIYASYSYESSRRGCDPFYSHQRWEHREDREWERHAAANFEYRRDHEAARPPHTWAEQRNIHPGPAESTQIRLQVAVSINQLVKRKDSPLRFQPVATDERQALTHRSQEVQQSRDQRRTLEARPAATVAARPGKLLEPVKVPLPRSPIVAGPASQPGRNHPTSAVPPAPKPEPKFQQNPAAGRQPNQDPRNQPVGPHRPETEKNAVPPNPGEPRPRARPVQPEAPPRGTEPGVKPGKDSLPAVPDPRLQAQQDAQRLAGIAAAKAAEDAQRNARESDRKAQQESEQQAKVAAIRAQEESQRAAQALKQQAGQDSARQAQAAEVKAEQDAQRNAREVQSAAAQRAEEARQKARELEKKAQQESQQQAKAPAARAQEDLQRARQQQQEEKGRKEPAKPDRKPPVTDDRDPPNPAKQNPDKEGK